MLCDELKVYVPQDGHWGLEPEEGGKLVEEETCYFKSEVDAAIAELKQKLEDAKATHYAEMGDAGMRERSLKRALWLARAEIAHMKIDEYWPDYCHNAHSRIALLKWEEVERKCLAKAKEYK